MKWIISFCASPKKNIFSRTTQKKFELQQKTPAPPPPWLLNGCPLTYIYLIICKVISGLLVSENQKYQNHTYCQEPNENKNALNGNLMSPPPLQCPPLLQCPPPLYTVRYIVSPFAMHLPYEFGQHRANSVWEIVSRSQISKSMTQIWPWKLGHDLLSLIRWWQCAKAHSIWIWTVLG